jgi:hypothetical protein
MILIVVPHSWMHPNILFIYLLITIYQYTNDELLMSPWYLNVKIFPIHVYPNLKFSLKDVFQY